MPYQWRDLSVRRGGMNPGIDPTVYNSNALELLVRLVQKYGGVGPMSYDARIAAVCVAAGVDEFLPADRDFSRFAELRVVNPLQQ